MEQLGAELVSWSPLESENLPEDIQGLYFGGGFPEVFAQQLAENKLAREAVLTAIKSGMPTYAECGGLMYLGEKLVDFAGKAWPMVGILPTTALMSPKLTLGYRQATAGQDSLLLRTGETIWGHEFHRSHLTTNSSHPLWRVSSSSLSQSAPKISPASPSFQSEEGWYIPQLHASYIHPHFGTHQLYLQRFLKQCLG